MSEARKEAWAEKKEGLLLNNKPSQSEPAKEEPKHDTRKDIAQAVGMSEARISQITKNKNLNNLSENPINSTSAAEEIAALQFEP